MLPFFYLYHGLAFAFGSAWSVKRCIAPFDHTNKRGKSKFLAECTLPLTGQACIDMVITDLGVFERKDRQAQFRLIEKAPDVCVDEIRGKTLASIIYE